MLKKFGGFFLFLFLFSCSDYVDKPKNLLSKDKMATIIADFAVNDQSIMLNPKGNLEIGTKYILKKHQVSATDFTESYKYYSVKRKLEGILEDAQKLLIEQNPDTEEFIKKKIKENKGAPPYAK